MDCFRSTRVVSRAWNDGSELVQRFHPVTFFFNFFFFCRLELCSTASFQHCQLTTSFQHCPLNIINNVYASSKSTLKNFQKKKVIFAVAGLEFSSQARELIAESLVLSTGNPLLPFRHYLLFHRCMLVHIYIWRNCYTSLFHSFFLVVKSTKRFSLVFYFRLLRIWFVAVSHILFISFRFSFSFVPCTNDLIRFRANVTEHVHYN